MDTHMTPPKSDRQGRPPAIEPSSPRFFLSAAAAASPGSHRRIAIAVDLSDESAYAVKWAVQNYLRPGDAVILLHVRSTSILYGADWGAIDLSVSADPDSELSQQKLEEDFDAFTSTKAQDLAQPLVEAQIPFKIHIVKDHDMKERLCLEVERLGLSAVIMGSRGFGASRRSSKSRLGSVSDYCVHHCVCPVVVVRFPDDGTGVGLGPGGSSAPLDNGATLPLEKDVELHPVPEEEQEYHDATDEHKGGEGKAEEEEEEDERATTSPGAVRQERESRQLQSRGRIEDVRERAFDELRTQSDHEHAELHLVQHAVPVEVPLPHHSHQLVVSQPHQPQRRHVPPQALRRDHPPLRIHQQLEPLAQLLHQPLRPQPLRHPRQEVLESHRIPCRRHAL
ncbi:unnamed protein product, partial [Musa hybrid cultivar]